MRNGRQALASRFVGRKTGLSVEYERADKHRSGQQPDFKELEIRLVPEETTRFAMLMSGEAHIVDLSRELQRMPSARA